MYAYTHTHYMSTKDVNNVEAKLKLDCENVKPRFAPDSSQSPPKKKQLRMFFQRHGRKTERIPRRTCCYISRTEIPGRGRKVQGFCKT